MVGWLVGLRCAVGALDGVDGVDSTRLELGARVEGASGVVPALEPDGVLCADGRGAGLEARVVGVDAAEDEVAVVVDDKGGALAVAACGLHASRVLHQAAAHAVAVHGHLLGWVGRVQVQGVVADDKVGVVVGLGAARGGLVGAAHEQSVGRGLPPEAVKVGARGLGNHIEDLVGLDNVVGGGQRSGGGDGSQGRGGGGGGELHVDCMFVVKINSIR